MFAGIMMTAMHKSMEGKSGLKGWQWVFLIGMVQVILVCFCFADFSCEDGLMGIPIGIFGFVSQRPA
jgi:ACS family pantothenate transporter-like MFS transporter